MLLNDIVLILSLASFCAAWFVANRSWRKPVLWVSAVTGLVAGLVGYLDWRWQAFPGLVLAILFVAVLLVGQLRTQGIRKNRIPWVSGALFTLLAGFSAWLLVLFPIFELPKPGGPHPVGVQDFELIDASRTGILEAADNEPRKLRIRAWYPAGDVTGLQARPYFTEPETRDTATSLGTNLGLPGFFFTHLRHVDTHSYPNAPLLQNSEPWPVVFFSHGYTSHYGQNTALMEHLASQGYLVYSVHHSFDGSTIRFDDGSTAPLGNEVLEFNARMRDEGLSENQLKQFAGNTYDERYAGTIGQLQDGIDNDDRITRSVAVWRDDRLFVLEGLSTGQVPDAVRTLARRGDYRRVAHLGMSFGGSTSGSVCQADPRCAAAVNMDGGNLDIEQINRDQPAPFLMFHSDWATGFAALLPEGTRPDPEYGFNDFAYERFDTAGLNPQVHRFRVQGSSHMAFSDMGMMVRQPVRSLLFGPIDGAEMVAIQNDVVLGFLDQALRGIDNGFPVNAVAAHPAIIPHSAGKVRLWWQQAKPDGGLWMK